MARTADSRVAAGRYKAPVMIEHDRNGAPLTKPYPRARRRLKILIIVAGLVGLAAAFISDLPLAPIIAVAALAAWLLPSRLIPMPYPAFLTDSKTAAYQLQTPAWIRLPDGHAVEALNVTYRVPDTAGDATPPQVHIRCSDDTTRHFRPHHLLHLVQPVDLR